MAWQRLLVKLKGEDPVEVQTNARDWAPVRVDGDDEGMRMGVIMEVAHRALMRMEYGGVPHDYDGFLEVLDGFPGAVEGDSPDLLDPTQPDR
jgi:hypothetical protein